jgi:hypothetical protein
MISLTEASIVSLLTFLAGLFLGHRLQLQRDRRKEFNDAVEPIRQWAISLKEADHHPPTKPSKMQMDVFGQMLGSKRSALSEIELQYDKIVKDAFRQDHRFGSVHYVGLDRLHSLGERLLKLTVRK